MFPRHDTRVKPSIVDGGKEFSIARLGASSDSDSIGGAFQDEGTSGMRIFEIDHPKLNGDYAPQRTVSPLLDTWPQALRSVHVLGR